MPREQFSIGRSGEVHAERSGADSVLAHLEKPVLRAIAERLPAWVVPDHLTAVGFLGACVAFICGALTHYSEYFILLGVFGLTLNWLGDSLDGTLARLRRIERPRYGFFVDHGCDLFAIILIGLGAGLSPYFSFSVAMTGVIAYLMVMVIALLRQHVRGTLQIAYAGIGPTEIRLAIALLALSYLVWPPQVVLSYDHWKIHLREALVLVCVCVEWIALFFFVLIEARRLGVEDPSRSIERRSEAVSQRQGDYGC